MVAYKDELKDLGLKDYQDLSLIEEHLADDITVFTDSSRSLDGDYNKAILVFD
jgi:hypothetical protein